MPLTIIRPKLDPDKRDALKEYITRKWKDAEEGRRTQVDDDYVRWSDAYEGVPLEEVRTVPFYKASNFVVKLIRIYIDTFSARTMNIIHSTRPLYTIDGMDKAYKDDVELYLNRKAAYEWRHYWVTRELCFRGNKNGTVIFKTPYTEITDIDVTSDPSNPEGFSEQEITCYRGPLSQPIPFEDFYLYPITVNNLCDAEIKFHRTRYTKEAAEQKIASGEFILPVDKELEAYLRKPKDVKRESVKTNAGISDPYTEELHLIESYLKWPIMPDGLKYYSIIVLFEETSGDVWDVYFNPHPRNLEIFSDYRPFPREDFFFGESLCAILGQSQEEASRIHNERRDNSTIASSVIFKRRNGSLLPNPSTNWYPGKVWDLDDMDDLDVINVGRNYEDMIAQEDYVFNFAERLSGIGEVMQGAGTGGMMKRGVYNTSGTLAVMAEGNQRQDTNIRDVREALGAIALISLRLQAAFDPSDPLIDTLPESCRDGVRKGLAFIASDAARYLRLEVRASDAGTNREVRKQGLTTIAQIVGQYAVVVQQLSGELMNKDLNQGLRLLMNDIVEMHTAMTKQLLKAYEEVDFIDELPDLKACIEAVIPGGSRGTQNPSPGQQPLLPGAPAPAQGSPPGPGMASPGAVPPTAGNFLNGAGVVPSNVSGQIQLPPGANARPGPY